MEIVYNIPDKKEALKLLGYEGITVADADEVQEVSAYGTPIFMPLQIDKTSYTVKGQKITTPALKLLCVVVEIQQTRNIVKTVVQGRDHSVKEFISNGDYSVKIKGLLSNDVYSAADKPSSKGNYKYPTEAVRHLHEVCTAPVALGVTHRLLFELGIYDIVVEDFSFSSTPGRTNIQLFEISAVSDRTYILQEKDTDDILKN